MNDLDLCLEVVSRSMSTVFVTFDVEYLGNCKRCRLGSKGPPIGNGLWRWPMCAQKVKLVTPIRLERDIAKTAGDAI